jgi:hypothetical protein
VEWHVNKRQSALFLFANAENRGSPASHVHEKNWLHALIHMFLLSVDAFAGHAARSTCHPGYETVKHDIVAHRYKETAFVPIVLL